MIYLFKSWKIITLQFLFDIPIFALLFSEMLGEYN